MSCIVNSEELTVVFADVSRMKHLESPCFVNISKLAIDGAANTKSVAVSVRSLMVPTPTPREK